ncbi:hypothetical protein SAMN05660297_02871 [Natronincola peptidivorans]|uniref:Uncharacterized protein n=1 Tax=Natronincola peptidivorans TaxID=426128 RepID=A0A1I0FMF0_9FIRM|nr:PepSY domain-containing protein [Natronincola peptidivorans]SET59490.1 hypothetical protein SAMN05660297_02871 [Natronincola peptidivorans]
MGILLGLLGIGVVFISSIFLAISFYRKKEKKYYIIVGAVGLLLCLAGVGLDVMENRDAGNNRAINPPIEEIESLSIDSDMNTDLEDEGINSSTTASIDDDTEESLYNQDHIGYEGLKIPREAITEFFSNDEYGFIFTEEADPEGIPMVIGSSAKHPTTRITILGYKENIKMAGIMYGIDGKHIVAYDSKRLKETLALEVELVGLLFPSDKFNQVIDWSVSTLEGIDLHDEDGLGPFSNTFHDKKMTAVYGIANNHVIKLSNIENIKDTDNDADNNNFAIDPIENEIAEDKFITEEEAIHAIMTLSEIADATEGEASFQITRYPSEDHPYYEMRVFKNQGTRVTTISFYNVDGYTGDVSRRL